jgi:hypothetical protein
VQVVLDNGLDEVTINGVYSMYKERHCLWKITSESYKNKNSRNSAIGEIVGFLKSSGFQEANTKIVKEKIQNIRRAMNKERKKVEQSRKSGAGSDEVSVPTSW